MPWAHIFSPQPPSQLRPRYRASIDSWPFLNYFVLHGSLWKNRVVCRDTNEQGNSFHWHAESLPVHRLVVKMRHDLWPWLSVPICTSSSSHELTVISSQHTENLPLLPSPSRENQNNCRITHQPQETDSGHFYTKHRAVELKKQEFKLRLYSILVVWPCWDVIVSGVEPTIVVLLNVHIAKPTSKYWCFYISTGCPQLRAEKLLLAVDNSQQRRQISSQSDSKSLMRISDSKCSAQNETTLPTSSHPTVKAQKPLRKRRWKEKQETENGQACR